MCLCCHSFWRKTPPPSTHLDEVARYVPPCDVKAAGQVWEGEALVDGADVSDAVAGVHHHAGQQSYDTQNVSG